MAETVLNYSPLAPTIGPVSPEIANARVPPAAPRGGRPADHEGVVTFDLSQDGRE
jgi:hypothetical protein